MKALGFGGAPLNYWLRPLQPNSLGLASPHCPRPPACIPRPSVLVPTGFGSGGLRRGVMLLVLGVRHLEAGHDSGFRRTAGQGRVRMGTGRLFLEKSYSCKGGEKEVLPEGSIHWSQDMPIRTLLFRTGISLLVTNRMSQVWQVTWSSPSDQSRHLCDSHGTRYTSSIVGTAQSPVISPSTFEREIVGACWSSALPASTAHEDLGLVKATCTKNVRNSSSRRVIKQLLKNIAHA